GVVGPATTGFSAGGAEIEARLQTVHAKVRAGRKHAAVEEPSGLWAGMAWDSGDWTADTAVPRATLERIVRAAAVAPEGFAVHPRVRKLMDDRVQMVEQDRID